MTLEIFKAYPPDSESAVAEINDRRDGGIEIPAEVGRENGELWITIFGRVGGVAWEYKLDDWVETLQRAAKALGEE